MARIAAVGDLHIGAGADLADPAGPGRVAEQAQLWQELCGQLHGCDLVLFCGDAFHRRRPTPVEQAAFRRGLDQLGQAGVIAVTGNHDVSHALEPNALTVFDRDLILCDQPRVIDLHNLAVSIACLPWTPPQWYRAKLAEQTIGTMGSIDNDDPDENVDVTVAGMLSEIARGLYAQCRCQTKILMLHWTVTGAQLPNGLPVDDLREPRIVADDLVEWDYVVASHIHRQQAITERIGYTGSPWVVDWGEAHTPHGYAYIDTGIPHIGFVSTDDLRPYRTLAWDFTEDTVGVEDIEAWCREWEVEGMTVRVRYRALASDRTRLDDDQIRRELEAAGARVYSIAAEWVKPETAGQDALDETAAPLEALDEWCRSRSIDDPRAEEMRQWTARHLEDQ